MFHISQNHDQYIVNDHAESKVLIVHVESYHRKDVGCISIRSSHDDDLNADHVIVHHTIAKFEPLQSIYSVLVPILNFGTHPSLPNQNQVMESAYVAFQDLISHHVES